MKRIRTILPILAAVILMSCVCAIAETTDYSSPDSWAYFEADAERAVDVFFIAPTNVLGSDEYLIADLSIDEDRQSILAGIGMQTGIYGETGRFFAPYYRQITLTAYTLEEEARESCLETAYEDVRAAFLWYMENENAGRPFIIAGFSQGAEHGLSLLKEFGAEPAFAEKLVAAYLIGWRLTDEDIAAYPQLKPAEGETDTGVIVCFECEAEGVDDTIIVPKGMFTHSINPLNWRTDATPASKEENLGYVYPAADGSVKKEIPQLCGAVIDPERGTIRVTDISAEDYPPRVWLFPEGCYHIYDYQFFYRNLQQNVRVRTESYLAGEP